MCRSCQGATVLEYRNLGVTYYQIKSLFRLLLLNLYYKKLSFLNLPLSFRLHIFIILKYKYKFHIIIIFKNLPQDHIPPPPTHTKKT